MYTRRPIRTYATAVPRSCAWRKSQRAESVVRNGSPAASMATGSVIGINCIVPPRANVCTEGASYVMKLLGGRFKTAQSCSKLSLFHVRPVLAHRVSGVAGAQLYGAL